MREQWERQMPGVPLVVVESPYRALIGPLLAYLDVLDRRLAAGQASSRSPSSSCPEYVARHWWERILYNQSAKRLRSALLGRPHTVVVNVPYRREDPACFDADDSAGGRAAATGARARRGGAPALGRACRPAAGPVVS